jgi:hypothetical protein
LPGALVGIRTRDLILTKNVLCLLSYKGTLVAVAEATALRIISYTLGWRGVIKSAPELNEFQTMRESTRMTRKPTAVASALDCWK